MKVAAVQMDVKIGEIEHNRSVIIERLKETSQHGAELTIFPECALSGYCFESLDEASPYAETVPGPTTDQIVETLKDLGCYAVFGMLTPSDDGVFNTAVLAGPEGVIAAYRKIHLPGLGVDQFATYGDCPFEVHEVGDIKVGLAICYDSAFPESSRMMTFAGADLIALPTNFPTGAENMTKYVINARAMENKIYFAAVNRVGNERGFRFIGETTIADPDGNTIGKGSADKEEILYFEVDPTKSREKRIVRVPGKHAIDRLADRRPEMYQQIVEPHSLPRPGRE